MENSGDNRLSRQRHYHGPGGLNGRVRNGNGCDPASMVAGNAPAWRSGQDGHLVFGWSGHTISAASECPPIPACGRTSPPRGEVTERGNLPGCFPGQAARVGETHRIQLDRWVYPRDISRESHAMSKWHRCIIQRLSPLQIALHAAPRSGWSSCLAVRTGRLKRSPAVHARPIDLVVFQEPTHYCWKPHLGGGFALRCLQRLSGPDLATRRCRERDSRYTRGRSSPILSY